jgi:hypothetical protein
MILQRNERQRKPRVSVPLIPHLSVYLKGSGLYLKRLLPEGARTQIHLVSEPSSLAEKLGCGLSLTPTFLPLGTAINRGPNFHLHRNSGSRGLTGVSRNLNLSLVSNYVIITQTSVCYIDFSTEKQNVFPVAELCAQQA